MASRRACASRSCRWSSAFCCFSHSGSWGCTASPPSLNIQLSTMGMCKKQTSKLNFLSLSLSLSLSMYLSIYLSIYTYIYISPSLSLSLPYITHENLIYSKQHISKKKVNSFNKFLTVFSCRARNGIVDKEAMDRVSLASCSLVGTVL